MGAWGVDGMYDCTETYYLLKDDGTYEIVPKGTEDAIQVVRCNACGKQLRYAMMCDCIVPEHVKEFHRARKTN